ncbi:MAG: MotA/TolQ/ExbB proton channel family protein [Alsobacter sp.]
MNQDIPSEGGGLSLVSLVLHADPVVQAVVAILVLCSIGGWTIILEKAASLARFSREIREVEALASGQGGGGQMRAELVSAVMQEWRDGGGPVRGTYDERARAVEAMRLAMAPRLRGLDRGLPFLATIGSAAPFIGLFGTVWGIMHSFSSIAQAKDTSLAVVAPGIAEALFATAIGLCAAIPAVMAYNACSTAIGRLAQRAESAFPAVARRLASQSLAEVG